MQLNHLALAIISLIPVALAFLWYHPQGVFTKQVIPQNDDFQLSWKRLVFLYPMSFLLLFGYTNLVIHQISFYELFFTDIMRGDESAKQVASDFLAQYGDKHRHLGHGVFHGVINAITFPMTIIGMLCILTGKSRQFLLYHVSYWFVTTVVVCGLISEFV